jgi:response regulator RpfG family c-di-GMP phosphodiesterase
MKIHPLAKIVTVADEFCKLVVKNPNMPEPLNAIDAFVRMEFLHAGYFDPGAVEALRAVFNLGQDEKAAA